MVLDRPKENNLVSEPAIYRVVSYYLLFTSTAKIITKKIIIIPVTI